MLENIISVELESYTLYELIESEIENKSAQELAFEKLVNIKNEYGRLKQENEELEEKNRVLQLKIAIINNNNKIVEEMNKDKLCEKLKELNEALSEKIKLINENKLLKEAVDIIKTKKVDINMFLDSSSVEDYNKRIDYYKYFNPEVSPLIQKEYNLLKEEFNKNE